MGCSLNRPAERRRPDPCRQSYPDGPRTSRQGQAKLRRSTTATTKTATGHRKVILCITTTQRRMYEQPPPAPPRPLPRVLQPPDEYGHPWQLVRVRGRRVVRSTNHILMQAHPSIAARAGRAGRLSACSRCRAAGRKGLRPPNACCPHAVHDVREGFRPFRPRPELRSQPVLP